MRNIRSVEDQFHSLEQIYGHFVFICQADDMGHLISYTICTSMIICRLSTSVTVYLKSCREYIPVCCKFETRGLINSVKESKAICAQLQTDKQLCTFYFTLTSFHEWFHWTSKHGSLCLLYTSPSPRDS